MTTNDTRSWALAFLACLTMTSVTTADMSGLGWDLWTQVGYPANPPTPPPEDSLSGSPGSLSGDSGIWSTLASSDGSATARTIYTLNSTPASAHFHFDANHEVMSQEEEFFAVSEGALMFTITDQSMSFRLDAAYDIRQMSSATPAAIVWTIMLTEDGGGSTIFDVSELSYPAYSVSGLTGILNPGSYTLSYTYYMSAIGTLEGGGPAGAISNQANLNFAVAAVPTPNAAVLGLIGLACIVARRHPCRT